MCVESYLVGSDDVESDAREEVDASKEADCSEESGESGLSEELDAAEAEESIQSNQPALDVTSEPQRLEQQETAEEVSMQSNEAGLDVAREAVEAQQPKQSEQRNLEVASALLELASGNREVTVQPTQAGPGLESHSSHAQQPDVQPAQATRRLNNFDLNLPIYMNDCGCLMDDTDDIAIQAQNNDQELQNPEEDRGIQARTLRGQTQEEPPEQGTAGRRIRLQVSTVDSFIERKGKGLGLLFSDANNCCNELHTTFPEVQLGGMIGWSEFNCGGISAGGTKGSTRVESDYSHVALQTVRHTIGLLSSTSTLPWLTSTLNLLRGLLVTLPAFVAELPIEVVVKFGSKDNSKAAGVLRQRT